MKRIICVLFALVLLFPVFSLADDSPYFGKWCGDEHHGVKSHETLHYVEISSEGFSNYYVFFIHDGGRFSKAHAEADVAYSGKWTALDDGTLRVPTSSITYVDLYLNEDGNLVCDNPRVVYVKLP